MTSQDTGECVCQMGELLILPAGEVPWSLWWLPASSGRTARGWGATGRELGVLGVGGAFVQYAQPLASRSRPSWTRPTRADSGQGGRPTMTTGTLRRRQLGSGVGGPMAEAPGTAVRTPDSLLRDPVSIALTLTSLPSKYPARIVGILWFLSVVKRRCARDVSTMDTSDPPDLFPLRIVTSRTTSPPKVPTRASASELITPTCLPSEKTAQTTRETNTPLRRRGRRGWCRGWVRSPGTHTGPRRHWGCRCRRRRRRTPCRRRRRRAWRPPAARVRSGGGGSR